MKILKELKFGNVFMLNVLNQIFLIEYSKVHILKNMQSTEIDIKDGYRVTMNVGSKYWIARSLSTKKEPSIVYDKNFKIKYMIDDPIGFYSGPTEDTVFIEGSNKTSFFDISKGKVIVELVPKLTIIWHTENFIIGVEQYQWLVCYTIDGKNILWKQSIKSYFSQENESNQFFRKYLGVLHDFLWVRTNNNHILAIDIYTGDLVLNLFQPDYVSKSFTTYDPSKSFWNIGLKIIDGKIQGFKGRLYMYVDFSNGIKAAKLIYLDVMNEYLAHDFYGPHSPVYRLPVINGHMLMADHNFRYTRNNIALFNPLTQKIKSAFKLGDHEGRIVLGSGKLGYEHPNVLQMEIIGYHAYILTGSSFGKTLYILDISDEFDDKNIINILQRNSPNI